MPSTNTDHTRISPSRLHQILLCPASLRMQESPNLPPEPRNPAAEDGTEKHALMEQAVTQYLAARRASIPDEQAQLLALNYLRDNSSTQQFYDLEKAWNRVTVILSSLNLSSVHLEDRLTVDPERNIQGTCDLWGFDHDDNIVVVDYKFGYIPVSPADNPQLRAYALGIIQSNYYQTHHSKVAPVVYYYIIQPKLNTPSEACIYMDYWGDLLEWQSSTATVLDQALDTNPDTRPVPTPSRDACQWCRAKAICKAYSQFANQQAAEVFSAYERLESARQEDELSEEELFAIYAELPALEEAIQGIKKCVSQKLFQGPKHGFKLVRTRGRRGWDYQNNPELELTLAEIVEHDYPGECFELYKSTLETPPALLKKYPKLKKNKSIEGLIVQQPGMKLSIVPDDDPRPAECNDPAFVFQDYLDQEDESN